MPCELPPAMASMDQKKRSLRISRAFASAPDHSRSLRITELFQCQTRPADPGHQRCAHSMSLVSELGVPGLGAGKNWLFPQQRLPGLQITGSSIPADRTLLRREGSQMSECAYERGCNACPLDSSTRECSIIHTMLEFRLERCFDETVAYQVLGEAG